MNGTQDIKPGDLVAVKGWPQPVAVLDVERQRGRIVLLLRSGLRITCRTTDVVRVTPAA